MEVPITLWRYKQSGGSVVSYVDIDTCLNYENHIYLNLTYLLKEYQVYCLKYRCWLYKKYSCLLIYTVTCGVWM